MFKNGDVHLAWFGGLTGVQARHAVSGARAIAQGEEDPQYKSYFIAHKDTGLSPSEEFPEGMAKFSFTFGSESSTSGRLMPESFIRKFTGKSPAKFFGKQPGFSGSHDKTVELVESGQVQTGAVNYKVYEKRVAQGKTDPATCKIIWTTPVYADYNFTVPPAGGADVRQRLHREAPGGLDRHERPEASERIPAQEPDRGKERGTSTALRRSPGISVS